jgi:hypothetical protein
VNHASQTSKMYLASRRLMILVAAGTFTLITACGSNASDKQSATAAITDGSNPSVDAGAVSASSPSGSEASGDASVQLDVDPCSLLTVPEIEVAIGSGVERGGFGEDRPGRCTYSIGGDVGVGVVAVAVDEPFLCGPLLQALDAGALDATNAFRVDIGDGGVFEQNAGSIQFAVGGGCVGIVGSSGGESLAQDALVALATAAAGRVG